MKIGIVGLGLIGGSLAMAYQAAGDVVVVASDRNEMVQEFARMSGVIDSVLTPALYHELDAILIAIPAPAAIAWLNDNASLLGKDTLVIDCCGTKRAICETGFALAREHGFTFVGGHPMAGTHKSGFKHARADLFQGASMVIVPPATDDINALERIKRVVAPAGFTQVNATTADHHDTIIAYTSQLAHVVSSAYIKSPRAEMHQGFSAGSFKDMTRVAQLDPAMWSDLFLENSDNLIAEVDYLVASLNEYRDALLNHDAEQLYQLLKEGSERKVRVDSHA